jgi:hypothetical protein
LQLQIIHHVFLQQNIWTPQTLNSAKLGKH